MGMASRYRCGDCGHEFTAGEEFSFGFLGVVVTPIVCKTHGLVDADTGVNVAAGEEIRQEVMTKADYPCPECGVQCPRWDQRSCPNCSNAHLEFVGQILWD